MKKVNVYDDGKWSRGINAEILRAKGKRLLIRFYDSFDGEVKTVWFKKVRRDGGGVYEHSETNMWFYKHRETQVYKDEIKEYVTSDYYNKLFNKDGYSIFVD